MPDVVFFTPALGFFMLHGFREVKCLWEVGEVGRWEMWKGNEVGKVGEW